MDRIIVFATLSVFVMPVCSCERTEKDNSLPETGPEGEVSHAAMPNVEESGALQSEQFKTLDSLDRTSMPYFSDFLKIYPDASVSYKPLGVHVLSYEAKTILHGRYKFQLQIPVYLTQDGKELAKFGDLVAVITEITSVEQEDGRLTVSNGESHEILDLTKLFESGGDFSELGIELTKDQPVEGIKWIQDLFELQHRGQKSL